MSEVACFLACSCNALEDGKSQKLEIITFRINIFVGLCWFEEHRSDAIRLE